MAVLSDPDRFAVRANFMRDVSDRRESLGAFMDTNATAINTAIPQPARGALTTQQKALLLQFVIQRRYLVS